MLKLVGLVLFWWRLSHVGTSDYMAASLNDLKNSLQDAGQQGKIHMWKTTENTNRNLNLSPRYFVDYIFYSFNGLKSCCYIYLNTFNKVWGNFSCWVCGYFSNTCLSVTVCHIIPHNDDKKEACETLPPLCILSFPLHILIGEKFLGWKPSERPRRREITWNGERRENGENLKHLRVGPAN